MVQCKKPVKPNAGPRPQKKAQWPKGWLGGLFLVLVFFVAAFLHVHSKLSVIELGYRLSEATKEYKQLLTENHKLQVEVATLKNPLRLRKMAQDMGLSEPKAWQWIKWQGYKKEEVALVE